MFPVIYSDNDINVESTFTDIAKREIMLYYDLERHPVSQMEQEYQLLRDPK